MWKTQADVGASQINCENAIWTGSLRRLGTDSRAERPRGTGPRHARQRSGSRRDSSLIQAAIFYENVGTLDQVESLSQASGRGGTAGLGHVAQGLVDHGVISHTWANEDERDTAFDLALNKTIDWVGVNGSVLSDRRREEVIENLDAETDVIAGTKLRHGSHRTASQDRLMRLFEALKEVDAHVGLTSSTEFDHANLVADRLVCDHFAREVGLCLNEKRDSDLVLPDLAHIDALSADPTTSQLSRGEPVLPLLIAEIFPAIEPNSVDEVLRIRQQRKELAALRERLTYRAESIAREENYLDKEQVAEAARELHADAGEAAQLLGDVGVVCSLRAGAKAALDHVFESLQDSGPPLDSTDAKQAVIQFAVCFASVAGGHATDAYRRGRAYRGYRVFREIQRLTRD